MNPASPQTFLHLTSGPAATDVIKETLRRLGRDETVIGMRDALGDGPLQDVDDGGACRIEWWGRIGGVPLDPAEARRFDDSDLWAQVRASPEDVMLWHGPHPAERIFGLRACWRLRDQSGRVHEVALPSSGRQWNAGARPTFYDAVPIVGANELVPAWERRAKVVDVDARAKQWEALRGTPGDCIRTLEGEAIVSRPITAYDAELVSACSNHEWTASLMVVGRVLADNPTGDKLLCWRVRELLGAHVLEGRGDENRLGLPGEIRAAVTRS